MSLSPQQKRKQKNLSISCAAENPSSLPSVPSAPPVSDMKTDVTPSPPHVADNTLVRPHTDPYAGAKNLLLCLQALRLSELDNDLDFGPIHRRNNSETSATKQEEESAELDQAEEGPSDGHSIQTTAPPKSPEKSRHQPLEVSAGNIMSPSFCENEEVLRRLQKILEPLTPKQGKKPENPAEGSSQTGNSPAVASKKKQKGGKKATIAPGSPPSSRLRSVMTNVEDNEVSLPQTSAKTVVTLPMIEVPGGQGTALVFRPFTNSQWDEVVSGLPAILGNGAEFAEELADICLSYKPTGAEICRLLRRKLKVADYAKLKEVLPKPDLQPRLETGDDGTPGVDSDYKAVILSLAKGIEQQFPSRANLDKIQACRQRVREPADDFLSRFDEVFGKYSGLTRPDDLRGSLYEITLCDRILAALLPELRADVCDKYVGYETGMNYADLRRFIIHCDGQLSRRQIDNVPQKVSTLYQNRNDPPQRRSNGPRGFFRGQRGWSRSFGKRQQRRPSRDHGGNTSQEEDTDRCWICDSPDHFSYDCDRRKGRRGSRSRQAD